ncbi:hypothetical protein [Serratia sp. JSRIV006]|uniref:hypothetical protein n=1 Tax=Serratia sp. JSRIV006 TaxID=2831896 RepID=UPI001CBB8511|nr:hypothetical protein [Serratia sp. JSRIV006]UAN63369.1 hypothetical protein KGP16_01875 [Serratia sp. JSRIV006]
MRIDNRLNRNGLAPRELFFIECWGSLSHKESIDTDRASFNNILYSMLEMKTLFSQGDKFKGKDKRRRSAKELLDILKDDPVLLQPCFEGIPKQIEQLLDHNGAWEDTARSPVEKQQGLMGSLFVELSKLLEKHYIEEAIELLGTELKKQNLPTNSDYALIVKICNNIMSFLLTAGMPLSECFIHYARILMNHDRTFEHRFTSWASKINVREDKFIVTLRIENEKLFDMLSTSEGDTKFNGCLYSPITIGNNNVRGTKITVETNAISVLSARVKAERILKESLDVLGYMCGRSQLIVQRNFTVVESNGRELTIKNFDNEIHSNNDRLTVNDFSHFMKSLSGLYNNASLESVRKVSSVFHFLRNGISSGTHETRFTSFWSALEALTLGVSAKQMDHDDHVIHTTPACMGLDYVVKQLIALRGIASYLNITITLGGGHVIKPAKCSLDEIFQLLKDSDFTNKMNSQLSLYPYALFMFNKFVSLCCSPLELGEKIIQHTNKVERHLYRLYTLRNELAHNAQTSPYIEFLTVNLEHYLRGSINALYYTSSMLPVIRSPEEAFQRYIHFYELTINQMVPYFGMDGSEKKKVEAEMKKNMHPSVDTLLIKWLSLHK